MKRCLIASLVLLSLLLYPASVLSRVSSLPVPHETTVKAAEITPSQTPLNASRSDGGLKTTIHSSFTLTPAQVRLRGEIADAIDEVEGRCTPGQSGEFGCYQILPATWRAYSIDVAGKVLPQTAENERYIVEGKIGQWLAEGVSPRGIFLTWNQGSATGWGGGTDCYAGTNKWGVHYDSCDYAHRALLYLAKLEAHDQ